MNHYITEIKIEQLRHLSNICICLNKEKRTNLLLTGKNGSGKTTVLRALEKYLTAIVDGNLENLEKNYPKWLNMAKKEMEMAKDENEKYDTQKEVQKWLNYISETV